MTTERTRRHGDCPCVDDEQLWPPPRGGAGGKTEQNGINGRSVRRIRRNTNGNL